jgi:hypothetical protein
MTTHTRGLLGAGLEAQFLAAGDCEAAGAHLPDGTRSSGRGARPDGRSRRRAPGPRESRSSWVERAGRNAVLCASHSVHSHSGNRRWERLMKRLDDGEQALTSTSGGVRIC